MILTMVPPVALGMFKRRSRLTVACGEWTERYASMEFLHLVDRVANVPEGVVRPENARPRRRQSASAALGGGGNPAAVQVDRLVAGGQIEHTAQVDLLQAGQVAPALGQLIDVPVVQGQCLGRDESVLLAPAGFMLWVANRKCIAAAISRGYLSGARATDSTRSDQRRPMTGAAYSRLATSRAWVTQASVRPS
jgi:hypothetical protein